jgi:integrase
MAKIKFLLQSDTENAQIYVRFSTGREFDLKKKTGLLINSKDWSKAKGLPNNKLDKNKKLIERLEELEAYIKKSYNLDSTNGNTIDARWLENCINECFEKVQKTDLSIFENYIKTLIENAVAKNELSKGTIKNYNSFKKIIFEYQYFINKTILFKDLKKEFINNFELWLLNDKKYTPNYAAKQLEFIKTICKDAQKSEIKVTAYSTTFRISKEKNTDRFIHTLSFEELDKIYNTEMPTEHLNQVKKWILIGAYIGQRGGDLLNLKPENIRVNAKGVYIDIVQQKTNKNVTIGVVKDYIIDILLNDFPEQVSLNKINKHISKVCEIAKINEVVKGHIIDKDGKRKQIDLPKYEFITSHSLRRSFATNFYKRIPTAVLIGITGHSTESMFLKYINQRDDKDANADLFMDFFEKMNKDKAPELKVIKNGTNN